MATQFITGNTLNHELEQLFENASEHLVLISPYICLHERYASVLKAKLDDHKLAISLVFGKNEEDPSRSMRRPDLEFFMQFPNIEIRYEPRLHAKYYANDTVGIITSMNLYRYSQDHNIEAGVKMEMASFRGDLTNRLLGRTDMEATAYSYFDRVLDQAEPLFSKVPQYEKGMLGLTKKYTGSVIVENRIAEYFKDERAFGHSRSKRPPMPRVVLAEPTNTPTSVSSRPPAHGYCIRTGTPIPFNPKRPLSDEAYKSWSRYKDENYKEKFCHFSGEASNGETTVSKPILRKNWNKAKAAHGL